MKCICEKTTYTTLLEANLCLLKIARTKSKKSGKKPVRAYKCGHCGYYHLTSQTEKEFKNGKQNKMNIYQKIENTKKKWAEIITKEIVDREFIDAGAVSTFIETRMDIAMNDIVALQISGYENDLNYWQSRYKNMNLSKKERQEALQHIIAIKPKKKQLNRYLHTVKDNDTLVLLKKYVKDTFGEEALKSFYDSLKIKENVTG